MSAVLIVGILINLIALPIVARRVAYLYRVITAGQPAPDRVVGVTGRIGLGIKTLVVEVLAQRKLLKWTVPGAAHAFVMWAFIILGSVYVEAYGSLFTFPEGWAIPIIGHWEILGFLQDFIAVMCLLGIITFAIIRLQQSPKTLGRRSRFDGSHTGGAWLVLFMIFNVLWTMFLFRGAAAASGNLPYDNGAFVSIAIGNLMDGLSEHTIEVIEGTGLILHIGVMLIFLIDVVHSKHLHIFLAPLNVLFKRQPVALGSVKPLMNQGKPVTLDDIDDLDEDAVLGVGKIEDYSWKGLLDFSTCTECGRCQDQCPAWNTEKPLSPKLLIMAMRDHAMAKGPLMLAGDDEKRAKMAEGSDTLTRELERPMVGDTGDDWFYMPENGAGVIDPDVLWSCVTCGACVNQCPVDIEHVDHIVDMRRYQVLVESNFPAELNQLFKGMENKGNPWNMSPTARMDWAKDLPFDVKVVGDDIESLDEVEWLFWVGCAGAYEDRAKKTTRAVAELLDIAGVSFGVLGNGETCTGDSARRAGNEFVFQGLAQQNIETFKEYKVKKVVSTCAHCFNTLKNEYKEFGIELEVTHHTQLLNRLVREGKLTPVTEGAGAHKRSITYHDPCYIGRHNGVYTPPRELLQVLPGAEYVEMERSNERSFCCGAGGARMWMEETIGSRINENRTAEAVGTGADQIAVGCPFCRVMLSDGLTAQQASGDARPEVEVLDVAQMLLASVKGEQATRYLPGSGGEVAAAAPAEAKTQAEAKAAPSDAEPAEAPASGGSLFDTPAAEPEPEAPVAKASSGGSLFDLGGDDEPAVEPVETPEPKPAPSSGGSLFDIATDEPSEVEPAETPKAEEPKKDEPAAEVASGGSLFDIAAPEPEEAPEPKAEAPKAETPKTETPKAEPAAEIPSGGSLFDIAAPEPEKAPELKAEKAPEVEPVETPAAKTEAPKAEPTATIPESGSLFDIAAPEPEKAPEPKAEKAPEVEPVETPAAQAAPAPTATIPEGGSLFDIAAPEPEAAPEPAKAAEPEPEPEPEPEEKAEEKPKPQASGEAHQPKTDVDINETGSLFDL